MEEKVKNFKRLLTLLTKTASKTSKMKDKNSNEFYNGCADVMYIQEELIKLYEDEINQGGKSWKKHIIQNTISYLTKFMIW